MSLGASSLFNAPQLSGLRKLGDIMLPANGDFAAFSSTGCIERIDDLMSTAHPDDVRDFGLLLQVCHYLPRFAVEWIVKLADNADRLPGFIAPLARTLNIGIKGVVVSLYYSGHRPATWRGKTGLDTIDYHVHCAPDQH